MPEGPEVRTVADKLRPELVGRLISGSYKGERGIGIGFQNLKLGAMITDVKSYGKKVLIYLETDHVIIISLGMEGRLQYKAGNHSHFRFDISNYEIIGKLRVMNTIFSLFFDDMRYMGRLDIIPTGNRELYFKDIGPDLLELALDDKTWISLDEWMKIFKSKRRMIWDALLDQSLVAGIGNYLQAEILYQARVHPERIMATLTMEEWDQIRISAHKIIKLSYEYGGCTIKSFISPSGQPGLYPRVVYGREGELDSNGYRIVRKKSKDRSLYFVPEMQK